MEKVLNFEIIQKNVPTLLSAMLGTLHFTGLVPLDCT